MSIASAKILVVDDDPAIRNLILRFLRQKKYEVESAEDGQTALKKFEQFNPDLVILDVNLPDGVGLDFISIAHKLQPNLKICVISAYDSGGEPERALHLGASNFLKKPFSKQEIIETVAQIQD